jgi:hypothetical protein
MTMVKKLILLLSILTLSLPVFHKPLPKLILIQKIFLPVPVPKQVPKDLVRGVLVSSTETG